MTESDPRLGLTITHRRYVPYAHAHYGGSLVDGAYSLGLFGDVATEVAIVMDSDEGLLAGYSEVRFLGPVRAGDPGDAGPLLGADAPAPARQLDLLGQAAGL